MTVVTAAVTMAASIAVVATTRLSGLDGPGHLAGAAGVTRER
jgi:hypothetical protein